MHYSQARPVRSSRKMMWSWLVLNILPFILNITSNVLTIHPTIQTWIPTMAKVYHQPSLLNELLLYAK